MENREVIRALRTYNRTLKGCTAAEKEFAAEVTKRDYLYCFPADSLEVSDSLTLFLKRNRYFQGLLKDKSGKLCAYLEHIMEYTCNCTLIRMDVRSSRFANYRDKVVQAVGSYYVFYGAGMSMKDMIYGGYRQLGVGFSFAPVIAGELLAGNEETAGYCRDVLTSENNTAVMTRDVIIAIEQSGNRELQDLLTGLFLGAKLQEGLRQSIIETVDENDVRYFREIVDVVERENLLRFSSVQRGVMTWIGIGYQEVTKDINLYQAAAKIREYLNEESRRREGLADVNPFYVYLALYCKGIYCVEEAIEEAEVLLGNGQRHIAASALIYLKMTRCLTAGDCMRLVRKYADDEWIVALCYSIACDLDWKGELPDKKDAIEFFDRLESFVCKMKARQEYHSKGFGWFHITLIRQSLCMVLYELVHFCGEDDVTERFLPYVSSSLSGVPLSDFMDTLFPPVSRKAKLEFMKKEIITSNEALAWRIEKEYGLMKLTDEEILGLEERLKTRKASARAHIVNVLARLDAGQVKGSYERLIRSSVKTIQDSAKELKQKRPECFGYVPEEKVRVLGPEEGFGLYQPGTIEEIPHTTPLKIVKKGLFKKTETADLSGIMLWDKSEVLAYFQKWNDRIASHAEDEYYNGVEYQQVKDPGFRPLNYEQKTLEALPLADIWRGYFEEDGLSEDVIFELRFLTETTHDDLYLEKLLTVHSCLFTLSPEEVKRYLYFQRFEMILTYYYKEYERHPAMRDKAAILLSLINHYCKEKEYSRRNYQGNEIPIAVSAIRSIGFLEQQLFLKDAADDVFCRYFPILYQLYYNFNIRCRPEVQMKKTIPPLVLARAAYMGLITKEVLQEGILDVHMEVTGYGGGRGRKENLLFEAFRDAYYEGRYIWGNPRLDLENYHHLEYRYEPEIIRFLREQLGEIEDHFLDMESTRLNEETKVTGYVESMSIFWGIHYLIRALHMLDQEEIRRQSYGKDRMAVFSNVIRHSYPMPGDLPEELAREHFPEKRLVETAMMAPQWIDIINQVLQWNGFRTACYYFIAHMKQYDYEQKKAEIARYTSLDPEDLNDGAFDISWCRQVYEELGEERFRTVYTASKFLCENAAHTRARKYADACLEKISNEELLVQITEKRNKDALNAYCVCPLSDDRDLLERYLLVQRFLKESRKFGAQRQASEKRACEIALMNLAGNSRFETVTRLTWMMESRMVSQYEHLLTPQETGDVSLWMEIDDQGQNQICISKKGKRLKTIPAALKQDSLVLELKEIHKQWTEQYRRSRKMLEEAMEERTAFFPEELEAVMKNPIVAPMMKKLVLINRDHYGFYENDGLRTLEGMEAIEGDVRIAHAYDLYEKGCWHEYQALLFEKKIVQPFKQVFRELYVKMEEELDQNISKRYSGYQIQVKKAAAALKTRKWNVSYDSGLERIYYKANLAVSLFADADWFSPSDIEAPSIDYVAFYPRKGSGSLAIRDVDDVLFSEIMRDVDLAVSTAYVGGVDPVTSFSTIELRRTIVEYTCGLMKLDHVSVQDHFANIHGTLNDYSVHLGSGTIHQSGGGAIYMIAVHSQRRGKVYLPFLDEDPKTAEILSKILFLAEDFRIKDPSILKQITDGR